MLWLMNTYRTITITGEHAHLQISSSEMSRGKVMTLKSPLKATTSAPISGCLSLQELRADIKSAEPLVVLQPTKILLTKFFKESVAPISVLLSEVCLSKVDHFLSTDDILVSIQEVWSFSLSKEDRLLNSDLTVTTETFFFVMVLLWYLKNIWGSIRTKCLGVTAAVGAVF